MSALGWGLAVRMLSFAAGAGALGASLLSPSVGAGQEQPPSSVPWRSDEANGLRLVTPLAVAEPVHGLVARCRSSSELDPRAVSVAEAIAAAPPHTSPAELAHALDSMAAVFAAAPQEDDVRRRHHEALLLGARVETLEGRERVEATRALHAMALEILYDAPDHAGARHILGRIHAAVMRLGGTRRFLARVMMGGEVLGSASWDVAREHLEHAERVGPCMPEHHLELALLLADTGDEAGAHLEAWHVLALVRASSLSPERATMLRTKALALLRRP